MSYLERTKWISLAISLYIALSYVVNVMLLNSQDKLSDLSIASLMVNAVIMVTVLEVILQTIIAIIYHKSANESEDERDKIIYLLSARNAYWVLSVGLVLIMLTTLIQQIYPAFIFFIEQLSPLYNVLHWVMVTFLLAEITKLASQLYLYRRGF